MASRKQLRMGRIVLTPVFSGLGEMKRRDGMCGALFTDFSCQELIDCNAILTVVRHDFAIGKA
jgi:hypothetical protein